MLPWRTPWSDDVLAHVAAWRRGAWQLLLGVAALGVGGGLAVWSANTGGCPSPQEKTRAELVQVQQALEMAMVQRGDRSCARALANATAAGWLHARTDGWGRPLHLRCLGETMVLRSTGPDLDDEWDDLVLVRPRR